MEYKYVDNCYYWYDHCMLRDGQEINGVTKAMINEALDTWDYKLFKKYQKKLNNKIPYSYIDDDGIKQEDKLCFLPDYFYIYFADEENDCVSVPIKINEETIKLIEFHEYEAG